MHKINVNLDIILIILNYRMDGATVSKLLADKWKSLPQDEQYKWYNEAERLKNLHLMQHPNYKYNPKSRPKKLSMKQSVARLDGPLVPIGTSIGTPVSMGPIMSPMVSPSTMLSTESEHEFKEYRYKYKLESVENKKHFEHSGKDQLLTMSPF